MSAVTGIYLFRLLLNIIFFALRYFLLKQTVHTLMKCRMMEFYQSASVKNMYRKIYFTIEMQPNIFFKSYFLFHTCIYSLVVTCEKVNSMFLRPILLIFWRQYFIKLRLMDSGNAEGVSNLCKPI